MNEEEWRKLPESLRQALRSLTPEEYAKLSVENLELPPSVQKERSRRDDYLAKRAEAHKREVLKPPKGMPPSSAALANLRTSKFAQELAKELTKKITALENRIRILEGHAERKKVAMTTPIIPAGFARLNITIQGYQGDLPDPVPANASDQELRTMAQEVVRGGSVPGIPAIPNASFEHFVVDRFAPAEDVPFARLSLRPKVPLG